MYEDKSVDRGLWKMSEYETGCNAITEGCYRYIMEIPEVEVGEAQQPESARTNQPQRTAPQTTSRSGADQGDVVG